MEPIRNRGGRPRGRTFTRRFILMLRPEEEEQIRRAADEEGVSMAEYVRRALRLAKREKV